MTATYTPIISLVTSSNTASIDITSIPSGYRFLKIVLNYVNSNSTDQAWVRFNGDTGGNYWYGRMSRTNTTSGTVAQDTRIIFGARTFATTERRIAVIEIWNHAVTDRQTQVFAESATQNAEVLFSAGRWSSNNAVSTITIGSQTNTFPAGTTINVWGIVI